MEGDAWLLSFIEAEEKLLTSSPGRKKTLAILKTLRDRHLDCLPGNPVTCYHLKVRCSLLIVPLIAYSPSLSLSLSPQTLTLFECEKHPSEREWDEIAVPDRILGILMQVRSRCHGHCFSLSPLTCLSALYS